MDKGILNGAFQERLWTSMILGYIDPALYCDLRFGRLYIPEGPVPTAVEYKTGTQVARL